MATRASVVAIALLGAGTSAAQDKQPDEDGKGFAVGVGLGQVDYRVSDASGRWGLREDLGQITTLQFTYRINPHLSVGAFQESGGAAYSYIAPDAAGSIHSREFRSQARGIVLTGTVFPDHLLRLHGTVSGTWAQQSLTQTEYRSQADGYRYCTTDSATHLEKCQTLIGNRYVQDSARKDSKPKFTIGVGVGIELHWSAHWQSALDFSIRDLSDDFFGNTIDIDSQQRVLTFTVLYGF